ncbi:MAG: hypothetical protein AAF581_17485 [Planctomycetota bacterium]
MRQRRLGWVLFLVVASAVAWASWSIYRERNPTAAMAHSATDAKRLRRWAIHAPDDTVRAIAVARVDDLETLRAAAENDRVSAVRVAATRRIHAQWLLAALAMESDDQQVRSAAVEQLTDVGWLRAVATGPGYEWTAYEAYRKLPDAALAEVLMTRGLPWRELALIDEIEDPAALARIALNASHAYVRRRAVSLVTDPFVLAQVATHEQDREVALSAAGRLPATGALAPVVRNAKHVAVRLSALSRMTEPEQVATVAAKNESWQVRSAAVDRLALLGEADHDVRSLFQRVACETEYPDVALAALARAPTSAGYATIARHSKSSPVRLGALERVVAAADLAALAQESEHTDVQLAALARVADPAVLEAIARTDQSPDARLQAVQQLQAFDALGRIALRGRFRDSRRAAIRRLPSDQDATLQQVALLDGDPGTRLVAVSLLASVETLVKVALNDNDERVRQRAVLRLEDSEALGRVALETTETELAALAIRKLRDPQVLAQVARHPQPRLRSQAVAKLTDSAVLARIAREDVDYQVRWQAVSRLTDEQSLVTIALADEHPAVSARAAGKVQNSALVGRLALELQHAEPRRKVVQRLVDPELLARVALRDSDTGVRLIAVRKIRDVAILGRVALEDRDGRIAAVALQGLSRDQQALADFLIACPFAGLAPLGVKHLTDAQQLQRVAREAGLWRCRVRAAKRIAESYRVTLVLADSSRQFRTAVISTLTESTALRTIATKAYYVQDRQQARRELGSDSSPSAALPSAELSVADDPSARILQAKYDTHAAAALPAVTHAKDLERLGLQAHDPTVLRHVLSQIRNKTMLAKLTEAAADPATRVAAARLAGATWEELARDVVRRDVAGEFHAMLAATELLPDESEQSLAAVHAVCLSWIRQGSKRHVRELLDVLITHGNRQLAEDYVNCGEPALVTAAMQWGATRGQRLVVGDGSQRVVWGSE